MEHDAAVSREAGWYTPSTSTRVSREDIPVVTGGKKGITDQRPPPAGEFKPATKKREESDAASLAREEARQLGGADLSDVGGLPDRSLSKKGAIDEKRSFSFGTSPRFAEPPAPAPSPVPAEIYMPRQTQQPYLIERSHTPAERPSSAGINADAARRRKEEALQDRTWQKDVTRPQSAGVAPFSEADKSTTFGNGPRFSDPYQIDAQPYAPLRMGPQRVQMPQKPMVTIRDGGPGPGSYDPPQSLSPRPGSPTSGSAALGQGGASLGFTEERFKETREEDATPGPGHYTPATAKVQMVFPPPPPVISDTLAQAARPTALQTARDQYTRDTMQMKTAGQTEGRPAGIYLEGERDNQPNPACVSIMSEGGWGDDDTDLWVKQQRMQAREEELQARHKTTSSSRPTSAGGPGSGVRRVNVTVKPPSAAEQQINQDLWSSEFGPPPNTPSADQLTISIPSGGAYAGMPQHRQAPFLHGVMEEETGSTTRAKVVRALSTAHGDLHRLTVLVSVLEAGPREWWAIPLVLGSRAPGRQWEDDTLVRYAANLHTAATMEGITSEHKSMLVASLRPHAMLTALVGMMAEDGPAIAAAAKRCSGAEIRQLSRIAFSSVGADKNKPAGVLHLNMALWFTVLREVQPQFGGALIMADGELMGGEGGELRVPAQKVQPSFHPTSTQALKATRKGVPPSIPYPAPPHVRTAPLRSTEPSSHHPPPTIMPTPASIPQPQDTGPPLSPTKEVLLQPQSDDTIAPSAAPVEPLCLVNRPSRGGRKACKGRLAQDAPPAIGRRRHRA